MNARKTRNFILVLIIWQSPSPLMLGFVEKVLARVNWAILIHTLPGEKKIVMFVLPIVRHTFTTVAVYSDEKF